MAPPRKRKKGARPAPAGALARLHALRADASSAEVRAALDVAIAALERQAEPERFAATVAAARRWDWLLSRCPVVELAFCEADGYAAPDGEFARRWSLHFDMPANLIVQSDDDGVCRLSNEVIDGALAFYRWDRAAADADSAIESGPEGREGVPESGA